MTRGDGIARTAADRTPTPTRIPTTVLDAVFAVYKHVVSPVLHAFAPGRGGCCYQPTCSEYAALACAEHGVVRGGAMAAWRVLRCNPFSRGGWDPVPLQPESRRASRTGADINQSSVL